GGTVVSVPIRSIRRPLLPCLRRLRCPRVAARLADRCVARRRFGYGTVGELAGRRCDDAFFCRRGIRRNLIRLRIARRRGVAIRRIRLTPFAVLLLALIQSGPVIRERQSL